MADKLIRVLTPQTTNGTELVQDDDGKTIYKETILAYGAKVHLESQNAKLPKSLRHKIEDYVEGGENAVTSEPKGNGKPPKPGKDSKAKSENNDKDDI